MPCRQGAAAPRHAAPRVDMLLRVIAVVSTRGATFDLLSTADRAEEIRLPRRSFRSFSLPILPKHKQSRRARSHARSPPAERAVVRALASEVAFDRSDLPLAFFAHHDENRGATG